VTRGPLRQPRARRPLDSWRKYVPVWSACAHRRADVAVTSPALTPSENPWEAAACAGGARSPNAASAQTARGARSFAKEVIPPPQKLILKLPPLPPSSTTTLYVVPASAVKLTEQPPAATRLIVLMLDPV
jgi:hypothetical protein